MKKTINKSIYSILVTIILVFVSITVAMSTVSATDYYVSTTGGDANDGLSTTTSKQSISEVTSTASSGDTIYLSSGVFKGLKNKDITINKSLSFIGNGEEKTIIDAEGKGRFFTILPDYTVTFKNITFKNAKAGDGGAIYNQGGFLTVKDCTFEKNSANYRGGAIFNEWSYGLNIRNSIFKENTAGGSGGAVYNFYSDKLIIISSQFFKNYAANSGAGVFNEYGNQFKVYACNFIENTANNCGGALYNFYGDKTTIAQSVFKFNKVIITSGGAIFNEQGDDFTVAKCEFMNNAAEIYGGAIDTFWGDRTTLSQNIFTKNQAGFGGAVFNEHSDDIVINKCEFVQNKANYGGAFYNFHGIGASIILPTISSNVAEWKAGEFLFNEWCRDVKIELSDMYKSINIGIYTTIPDEITISYS